MMVTITKPMAKLRNASSSGKISRNEGNQLKYKKSMWYNLDASTQRHYKIIIMKIYLPIKFVKSTNRCLLTCCGSMCKFCLRSMFKIRTTHCNYWSLKRIKIETGAWVLNFVFCQIGMQTLIHQNILRMEPS